MATAFAALVNIMQIIDEIEHHPRPPISLDKQQVQSLIQNVTFLQEFLEVYNNHLGYNKEADPVEMRIADAAHAVEDVIESHIAERILAEGEETGSVDFHEALKKVIEEMEYVKKEVMGVKEKMRVRQFHQLHGDSSTSSRQNATMVGFDGILLQVLDKLKNEESSRQIISIAGMGGMGKTTLAINVYTHQLVVEYFDYLGWVTISQEYNIREVLLKVLEGDGENLGYDENELGYKLHKKLSGRRYLIIMDDIWSIEVWYRLRLYLPDNKNGSRIMITTRLSNLPCQIDDSYNIEMDFLDQNNSWELFCKHVFGEGDCPLQLREIGNNIVKGCKGLPLSISVVGGLLAKSPRTQQHWEHIAENLSSIVNLEDDEHCLQILYMSYNSLPLHLKPCFLYMGVFGKDEVMFNFFVIAYWVAEGFVKPISGKSLEEAAQEYLSELVERNLLLIDKKDKVRDLMYKECNMHDLLRDLCLRESEKQEFVRVVGERSLNIPRSIRRICIAENTPEEEVLPLLQSATHVRSLWLRNNEVSSFSSINSSCLLRVATIYEMINNLEVFVKQVNLRFIIIEVQDQCRIPSSISHFWNLQTLSICRDQSSDLVMAPIEIWMMPQLRCIFVERLCLPDPPISAECLVMENLHTLAIVHNLNFTQEVVKRIPNIKFLVVSYTEVEGTYLADYSLNNLGRLQLLEWLRIEAKFMQNHTINFPSSLKTLILFSTNLDWDEMTTKIASLPLLQFLALHQDSCIGAKWRTVEGQFRSLKYLIICGCHQLEDWITESNHFPRLERLFLEDLHKLNEIPSCIGDIPTLEYIKVENCCNSVCDSAEQIRDEQEELGNQDLQVQIRR